MSNVLDTCLIVWYNLNIIGPQKGTFFEGKIPMIPTLLATLLYALVATKNVASDFVLGAQSVRAERTFSLQNRYPVQSVSDIFRDNILLTLSYMDGDVSNKDQINWSNVTEKQTYSFTLKPGEVFAFHDSVLPEYEGKVVKTMNAHFNYSDGFKTDGLLYGDGVCHLASFLYWVALDAGLTTKAPTNHDFMAIPEVPKEYGVSIYFSPDSAGRSEPQNLYIENTLDKEITFTFTYDGTNLTVTASE